MRIVRYEYSIDPVLRILQDAPEHLFGKHYAGYILFLFGDSDEEFATWFSKRLSSLDSLTGEFLAGAVFAKRVRLFARQGKKPAGNWEPYSRDSELEIARIEDISTHPLPQTNWTTDEREIVATTYGSDELATRLGLLEDLPCMVVLDARTPAHVEILRLDPITSQNVISLFRRVVSRLTTSSDFTPYWQSVRALERLRGSLPYAESALTAARERLEHETLTPEPPIFDIADLRDAILNARTKQVRPLLERVATIAPDLAARLRAEFEAAQPL